LSARRAIASGTVVKTASDREKYWNHWVSYAKTCKINPWLLGIDQLELEIIVSGFAARIRAGNYGRGNQVTVSTVQNGLSAITKTLKLAGKSSPLYKEGTDKYKTTIQRLIEGYQRQDPPVVPQIAVPVAVPNLVFTQGHASGESKQKAIGNLSLIAFYYLLRVGEYTQPKFIFKTGKKIRATRTRQFTVGNVGFFNNGKIVPRTAPLSALLQCEAATLKISNQKNGKMGDVIHHECVINSDKCPIKALAYQVNHVLSNGGTHDSLLCTYYDPSGEENTITSKDIISAGREATKTLQLQQYAIDPTLVGSHLLRAGGAMAMRLNGLDDTTIQKYGRWKLTTFLM
jgi:hypothetical protein